MAFDRKRSGQSPPSPNAKRNPSAGEIPCEETNSTQRALPPTAVRRSSMARRWSAVIVCATGWSRCFVRCP